jgi:hypothetical protein
VLYNLPNGKTIELTVLQWMEIYDNDEEWGYLLSLDYGDEINNPFYGSALHSDSKLRYPEEDFED